MGVKGTTTMKLHPIYETGSIGLTDKEKEAEEKVLRDAIQKRMKTRDIIQFKHQTPQEIHRFRVISAMKMADSCIVYGMEYAWEGQYSKQYQQPLSFKTEKEKRDAYALTKEECDAIFKAQKERLAKASIIRNAATDAEEVSYNSVIW
jgi:hypothetical protein